MVKDIRENKVVLALLSLFVASILGWGTWVTVELFAQDKNIAVSEKDRQGISKTLENIKKDAEEVKIDVKKMAEKMADNQEEMLKILLDIKKESKRR
jgi:peptidoglycan hydrolase CwlO-like protein